MRLNSGESFFHPVTHRLIESNSFYKGAAHLEHEDIEEIEEETKGSSKTGKGKSNPAPDNNGDNNGDKNEDGNK